MQFRVQKTAAPRLPGRKRSTGVVIRAAAVLAAGFLAGYLTADWMTTPTTLSVPQYLETSTPKTPPTHFTSCDQVDIAIQQPAPGLR